MTQSLTFAPIPPDAQFDTERLYAKVTRQFLVWWRGCKTRQIVSELTNEQLADAGIDPSSVLGPRCIQIVERGYHANATGWR